MNIAANLLKVQTADGFDVMCDSVFLSCVENGFASFDVGVLEIREEQDQLLIKHSNPSQDAASVIKFICRLYIYIIKSSCLLVTYTFVWKEGFRN